MPLSRFLLAAILGGTSLFVWDALSHMAFGLGEVGIKQLPTEEPVLTAMRASIPESGLYFFPGMGGADARNPDAQKQWEEKLAAGPSGILAYTAGSSSAMAVSKLITEFLSDIVAVFILSFLTWKSLAASSSIGAKMVFCSLFGIFANVVVDVSYWNWYNFPGSYLLAQLLNQIVGFGLVGAVLAWRLKS